MSSDEFDIIERYFHRPLPARDDVLVGIGDDGAVVRVDQGQTLVTSVATLSTAAWDASAGDAARLGCDVMSQALAPLTAAGARPAWATLALTLPRIDHHWLAPFSDALFAVAVPLSVALIGGDTTRGPLTITVQVMGAVPEQRALTRDGAKVGDLVYVSGTLGDAAAALSVMHGEWPGSSQYKEYLLSRHYRPSARIDLGKKLLAIATSAIDVSDGLLADAGHLCERSGVGISIEAEKVPMSPALQTLTTREQAKTWALSGGDDYELLFTVPAGIAAEVPATCTCIGAVITGNAVTCDFEVATPGYDHFATLIPSLIPSDPTAPPDPRGLDTRSWLT